MNIRTPYGYHDVIGIYPCLGEDLRDILRVALVEQQVVGFVPLHLDLGYVLILVVATIAPRFPMVLGNLVPRFHLYLFRERILPRRTNNTTRNAKKLSI